VTRHRHRGPNETPRLDSETVAALPDKLAAITLDLRRLCYDDAAHIGPRAVVTIGDCCDRLHVLMSDVLKIVRYLDADAAARDASIGASLGGENASRKRAGGG
jgi:hypothetical protein